MTRECDVQNWAVNDVRDWLTETGFEAYTKIFCEEHKIDGIALLSLREKDLTSPPVSIATLGDVKRLMFHINILKSRQSSGTDYHDSPSAAQTDKCTKCTRSLDESNAMEDTITANGTDGDSPVGLTDGRRNHNWSRVSKQLNPEFQKLIISYIYMFFVFMLTAMSMVIVHDRVPDMLKYPPLPDLVLDNLPYIPWAFEMCEATAIILFLLLIIILVFHNYRFIIMRRLFALAGTVFLLRCITMLITSLSVPGKHLQCQPQLYNDSWTKLERAYVIWKGFGMSIQGVRTCGDYMFSGHTVVVTLLNFFITEYSPRKFYILHTAAWVMNIFGIFFILAAHEHYSIDVFIAFYITSRLFLYYHSLANNRVLLQSDHRRTRIWFPLFSYFESSIDGIVPNEFNCPFSLSFLKTCKSAHQSSSPKANVKKKN